ncbi:MAG: hypothetical protein CMH57_11175, partial [Myxococcales bacterium]|nr:hypothetical protein [Myxococcales bacterium]
AANFLGETSPAPEIDFPDWNNSINRYPDGADTGDNALDFVQSFWATPGAPNTPQQPLGTRLTGVGNGVDTYPVEIPDFNSDNPQSISVTIPNPGFLSGSVLNYYVGVQVAHTYRGDLNVTITSPGGTEVLLRSVDALDSSFDLFALYDFVDLPAADMAAIDGEVLNGADSGDWTLTIADQGVGDTGFLLDWVLWVETVDR